jgi:hypothetical protein
MVELATDLPAESLSASEVERLRERPAVSSVIELPTGTEHRRNVTSTAIALAERQVLYLTLDAESGRWKQRVLAREADERELLEVTLEQLDRNADDFSSSG